MSDETLPILCEDCFGYNPYVRMSKHVNGANCKMCDRIYTVYRWNPNRGVGNRSTEICRICSNLKNLCQTCIKDLQYGLPSQLRDAVLSIEDSIFVPQNSINQRFSEQNELLSIENGDSKWNSLNNPNERLIKIARETVQNRDKVIAQQPKVIEKQINSHHESQNKNIEIDFTLPLPPGINSIDEINVIKNSSDSSNNKALKKKKFALKDGVLPPKPKGPPPSDIAK